MSANRVFRVLAGGSLRWALCEASTSPVRASATSHATAETSRGSPGAPGRGRTWTPGRYSGGGSRTALASSAADPTEGPAPRGLDATASAPIAQRAEQQRATRDENPMVIPQT
ncbi:hypothetical protein GCM10017771_78980 [Streptomyces capitiformicae]|uniref:Uncharacterized protein n=1 Tax=Streptomyces capitiformicae TaxID=2014920 RepID=A0A918ZJE4_9ACTN|nr:hypothetical protein GCM10017771_78980 [Streptomyces capitiformicae]